MEGGPWTRGRVIRKLYDCVKLIAPMNPDRLRQIEELYHLSGERAPEERNAFLTRACNNDAELLRAVQVLLAQDSGPMNRPVLDVAAKLLADASWTPGTQVGPYEIMSRLGEGGMGEVFKARDTRLGREVAIKTAHEEFSGRFLREARAISSLNHPNICTLHDVGPNYLVMELVQGANLAGPVPIETAIAYARQIAAGLEAAHEKGIVHRDLKPANIKVTLFPRTLLSPSQHLTSNGLCCKKVESEVSNHVMTVHLDWTDVETMKDREFNDLLKNRGVKYVQKKVKGKKIKFGWVGWV
jgi:serine/threonine protein kinase